MFRLKDFLADWKAHSSTSYHKEAVLYQDNFVRTLSGGENVVQMLDSARSNLVKKNRRQISAIIKAIIFLVANECPLRGHRDSGKLIMEIPDVNDGLLRRYLAEQAKTNADAQLVLDGIK